MHTSNSITLHYFPEMRKKNERQHIEQLRLPVRSKQIIRKCEKFYLLLKRMLKTSTYQHQVSPRNTLHGILLRETGLEKDDNMMVMLSPYFNKNEDGDLSHLE